MLSWCFQSFSPQRNPNISVLIIVNHNLIIHNYLFQALFCPFQFDWAYRTEIYRCFLFYPVPLQGGLSFICPGAYCCHALPKAVRPVCFVLPDVSALILLWFWQLRGKCFEKSAAIQSGKLFHHLLLVQMCISICITNLIQVILNWVLSFCCCEWRVAIYVCVASCQWLQLDQGQQVPIFLGFIADDLVSRVLKWFTMTHLLLPTSCCCCFSNI